MTAGAQARGSLGVVISGRCRDIAEHGELQFPVFSRGTSTLVSDHTLCFTLLNWPFLKITLITTHILGSVTVYSTLSHPSSACDRSAACGMWVPRYYDQSRGLHRGR